MFKWKLNATANDFTPSVAGNQDIQREDIINKTMVDFPEPPQDPVPQACEMPFERRKRSDPIRKAKSIPSSIIYEVEDATTFQEELSDVLEEDIDVVVDYYSVPIKVDGFFLKESSCSYEEDDYKYDRCSEYERADVNSLQYRQILKTENFIDVMNRCSLWDSTQNPLDYSQLKMSYRYSCNSLYCIDGFQSMCRKQSALPGIVRTQEIPVFIPHNTSLNDYVNDLD